MVQFAETFAEVESLLKTTLIVISYVQSDLGLVPGTHEHFKQQVP